MKYIGKFKDLNEKLYTIEIITNHDSSLVREITLTDEPIVTSIKGNDKNIYEPLRCSESTIKVVTETPLLDIYSPAAKGTSVRLLDIYSNVKWIGYVEPLLYNQDWESDKDILEINCLDGLAILQYIDYSTDEKRIKTFVEIISNLLSLSGCYTNFYLPSSLSINGDNTIINNLTVSENNFFDEDGEPMTCQEVLENITKFLNFTCIAYNNEVYFLDYDAIKNGNNSYYKYTVGSTFYTTVTLNHTHDIDASSYSENGAQISLSNVYNKVTVKSDLYPIESVSTSIWDNLENYGGKGHTEIVKTPLKMAQRPNHVSFFQFFKNKYWLNYYYPLKGDLQDQSSLIPQWNWYIPNSVNYFTLRSTIGATIVRHECTVYERGADKPAAIDFTNYLVMHIHDKFPISNMPLFVANMPAVNVLAGRNSYLVFSGNVTFFDDIDDFTEHGKDGVSEIIYDKDHHRKKDNFHQERLVIEVELRVNNWWWDGFKWVIRQCTFNLPLDAQGDTDNFIGREFPIKNNITYEDNIGNKGWKIPLKEEFTEVTPEFKFFCPKQRIDDKYRLEAIWISNFDIKMEVANTENTNKVIESEKTDTEYSNVINDSYVKEMDEIKFQVCTYDNKTPNYSCVSIKNGGYVDGVSHLGKEPLRMEENLIQNLVHQYSSPAIILDVNFYNEYRPYSTLSTHFYRDKLFIVDSAVIDWAMNQSSLHIIEKK